MVMTIDESDYYTAVEACAALKVKPATLYSYVGRGLVHSYRQGIGRSSLYRRDEIEALLAVRPKSVVPGSSDIPLAESWIPYV